MNLYSQLYILLNIHQMLLIKILCPNWNIQYKSDSQDLTWKWNKISQKIFLKKSKKYVSAE